MGANWRQLGAQCLLMAATMVQMLDGSSTSWAIVVGEQGNVLKSLDNGGDG
jgi:hypothetical protein